MAAVAGCPYKVVKPREPMASAPHEHSYPIEMATDVEGVVIRDCWCGHRERVRMVGRTVVETFPDAVCEGGALENVVYVRRADGSFTDRWSNSFT